MQMLLGTVLIDALHPALEDAVEAFNRVDADRLARPAIRVSPFVARVVNSVMMRKLVAELAVLYCFVRHHMRLFGDVRLDDRDHVLFACAIDMEGANLLRVAV